MSSLLDTVMQQMQGGGIQQLSKSLGLGEADVTNVVSGANPALMSSLIKNGGSGDGAASLLGALDRDHDGSILDDIAGFLGQSGSADAAMDKAGDVKEVVAAKAGAAWDKAEDLAGSVADKVSDAGEAIGDKLTGSDDSEAS